MSKIRPPKLVDDPTVREAFGSELVSVSVDKGVVFITLATNRVVGDDPPKVSRVVTARVALTTSAAAELARDLTSIFAGIAADSADTDKPN